MTDPCLSMEELAAFADGNTMDYDRPRIEGHLSRCYECRKTVAFIVHTRLAEQDPDLSEPYDA